MTGKTLYDKILDAHTIERLDDTGTQRLAYIDRTVINEYTSPQAFTLLRESNRRVWRPDATLATVDHVNPSYNGRPVYPIEDNARGQVQYMERNARDFGFEFLNVTSPDQGIEHVVMCEQGRVLPGMFIGAGDSHTATYGALGAIGYGIGTSDIYHYLATQTLPYKRLRTMRVRVEGVPDRASCAKDVVMAIVRGLGASGATGYCVEFCGGAIDALSVEGRMTVCNMAVECGARSSIIAPDEKVFEYLKGRDKAPRDGLWDQAIAFWKTLASDADARFDKELTVNVEGLEPMVTWGTSPDQAVEIRQTIPDPANESDPDRRRDLERALSYMGLVAGDPIAGTPITHAFIGSCTNSRIEDLREAARILAGRHVAPGVTAMVIPGSMRVRAQAEREGIAQVFRDAGWDFRESGCSLCLAMNGDILGDKDRCISATNRNFEGRQGVGTRTHLASPAMVAAASVAGRIVDVRDL